MTRGKGCLLALMAALTPAGAGGQVVAPPADVEAFDTPNDAGGSITLTWPVQPGAPPGTTYLVYVAAARGGPFHLAAQVPAGTALRTQDPAAFGFAADNERYQFAHVSSYSAGDSTVSVRDGRVCYVRLGARTAAGEARGPVLEVTPRGNWFNRAKLNNFVLGSVFSIVILVSIALARRRELKIRRIAGLEALDEALGRATEMGKPVLFVHGLGAMDNISTIAAVNILGRVARRTARYDTALLVVNNDPVVLAVSQETVKEACVEAGRPDAFSADDVFMPATDQFSYAAAVEGIMVRQRPAAHIMMGYFYAEALLLAETGATTGAIQIAGTDAYTQLPFFITTCDYTLMGEELYAASAYLSREPMLLGSLKGQDAGKAVLLVVIAVGTALATAGLPYLTHLFKAL